MLLSLNWLKQFVPYNGTAEELGDRLTMLGLELEEIRRPFDEIANIVIGKVLTCEDHPDSDHLHVCTVDVGAEEILNIVCGAPNVEAGQFVPVATVGTVMPGGFEIKKAKLRGVPSFGMICSERELGLSEEHSGILVLPEKDRQGNPFKIGEKFVDAMEMDREVLEISITPNRADCLSVLGFARVVSAIYNLPLTLPKCEFAEQGQDISAEFSINVEDSSFCPSYTARLIENCKIEKSPYWIRYRLHAVGLRAISNVVDVTNYILMELGQPLHAFDANTIKDKKVIVKRAIEGQKFTTLDGQERTLTANDGLICDAENAIALGGVMGGLDTEITDSSKNVLLECALFEPASIRKTARRLGLHSDASYRFERGVDQEGMDFARDRAAYLLAYYAGGTIRTGVCKHTPIPFSPKKITFSPSRPEVVLGIPFSADFCENVFKSIGCGVEKLATDKWLISAPGCRYDLSREADLIEEIAIFYGIDTFPPTLPRLSHNLEQLAVKGNRHELILQAKKFLAGLGLNEVINYSFVGNKDLDNLNLNQNDRVQILNPLTSEQDVLRTHLAAGILQSIKHNIAHGATGLRIFEIAHSFHKDSNSQTTVRENLHLAIGLYGNRYDSAWGHSLDAEMDYSDLRGFVEHFCTHFFHLSAPSLKKVDNHPYFAPAIELSFENGEVIGYMGRIKPSIADDYYAKKPVWLADLDLNAMAVKAKNIVPQFENLAIYPPVRRDITFICPSNLTIDCLEQAILSAKGKLLKSIELRDIFYPQNQEEKNLTFRLTFQSSEKTLEDKDVDKEREKITTAVIKSLNIKV